MNNSITNESIWGKLSDMDKKLSKIESSQSAEKPSVVLNLAVNFLMSLFLTNFLK